MNTKLTIVTRDRLRSVARAFATDIDCGGDCALIREDLTAAIAQARLETQEDDFKSPPGRTKDG